MLAAATDTTAGVVVAWVDPDGPAAGVLEFGDVIERVNGQPVNTTRTFGILEARAPPGTSVTVRVFHQGEYLETVIVATSATPPEDPEQAARLGLVLRPRAGSGAEIVSIEDATAASRADLLAGDLITSIGNQARPTPAQVRRAYAEAGDGTWLLVGVRRGERRLVVALEKR
jgi:S1-C subfamily serine protease